MATIDNWPGMLDPLNSLYTNIAANAGQWLNGSQQATQDAINAWKTYQEEFLIAWAVAQAAYAAAQVLLANNALKAAENLADQQYDLADRQLTIAEQEYARFTEYFAPCENATVSQECARPEYTEPIYDEQQRAIVGVRAAFANSQQQANRNRQRYCFGAFIGVERTMAIEQARTAAQTTEQVRRFLEDRQFNRQQVYYNRKLQILNLGRGLPAEAISGIQSAAAIDLQGDQMVTAARNQFYGAILSGLGGVMGAGISAFLGPSPVTMQGLNNGMGIGGYNSFTSVSNFGGTSTTGASALFGQSYSGTLPWMSTLGYGNS